MKTVIIIGGGASGMAAAYAASINGNRVILLEKNEKLGKKVYISGKGRCNLTNDSDVENHLKNVISNPKFLYSAAYSFTPEDVKTLLEKNGCPVKTERGNRVFPVSDHASDVIRTFEKLLREKGTDIRFGVTVKEVMIEGGRVKGVLYKAGARTGKIEGDGVIIATGGLSYPLTGSTGDGYRFAEEAGHQVTELLPALVPLKTEEAFVRELAGLSLRNVEVRLMGQKGCYFKEFGEMLFTHEGVSGPLILSASSAAGKQLQKEGKLQLFIDLKPALSMEELDSRLLRDFEEQKNKQIKNVMGGLLPSSMIPFLLQQAKVDPDKPVHGITRGEREAINKALKAFPLTVNGFGGFSEAIVTKGGVSVKEIDPSTMESKLVKGLYFAGEVMDVDGLTGGYNLQIAWSTGYLAGMSV